MSAARPRLVWLIAGEESGDQLGAKLMRALKAQLGAEGVAFGGVGGHAMEGEGLRSVFPLTDIAVMGLVHVVARLPSLLRRASAAVAAAVAAVVTAVAADAANRAGDRSAEVQNRQDQ